MISLIFLPVWDLKKEETLKAKFAATVILLLASACHWYLMPGH